MQFRVALSRWWVVLPLVAVLAAAVLVPGLGSFGLWEPQERQLADRQAPRLDMPAPAVMPAPLPAMACPKIAPKDALARSLVPRAMVLGRDYIDDSDAGRRLPFALLGILAILATAGIAMRTIGARAGLIAAVIALSMPLFVLQARQLTTEIGTATAGALVIYGLLALRSLEDVLFGAFVPRTLLQTAPAVRIMPASLEAIVGALALAAGLALGFVSGGALLGVAVPLGCVRRGRRARHPDRARSRPRDPQRRARDRPHREPALGRRPRSPALSPRRQRDRVARDRARGRRDRRGRLSDLLARDAASRPDPRRSAR